MQKCSFDQIGLFNDQSETEFTGSVAKIIYQDIESDFYIFALRTEGSIGKVKRIKAKGTIPGLMEGENLRVKGHFSESTKYGPTFEVESFKPMPASSIQYVYDFLTSGIIKGVGPKLATEIVNVFGLKSIEVLQENPQCLLSVKGIGEGNLKTIVESFKKNSYLRVLGTYLHKYGISIAVARRIYKVYGAGSIAKIEENPYCLVKDVDGIGFKKADVIALKLGMAPDSVERIRACILYCIQQTENQIGGLYLSEQQLVSAAMQELAAGSIPSDKILSELNALVSSHEVVMEFDVESNTKIFCRSEMYYAEKNIADRLARLTSFNNIDNDPNAETDIRSLIEQLEHEYGYQFNEKQREAILLAAKSHVFVLTGGPGTGKTTVTRAIVDLYKSENMSVLLAAPTGRAAKRLSEATGKNAKTIHRLLEWGPNGRFAVDEDNPLQGHLLVVDESSMIDTKLMSSLLSAVPDCMRVVIIGDVNQLPSVGPGRVMRDIIESDAVPVVELTEIYRQNEGSRIVVNARDVNLGKLPVLRNSDSEDFFFFKATSDTAAKQFIRECVSHRIPTKYGVNPQDVQILSPIKKGEAGVYELNQTLQSVLNPPSKNATIHVGGVKRKNDSGIGTHIEGGYDIGPGDKVMQTRNNYNLGVFNGDIGTVLDVDTVDKTAIVIYDDVSVEYELEDLSDLVLAYACTIHKSQGSEYPFVIIPVLSSHSFMLDRNIIYTAITRAKKFCLLVGTQSAIAAAVKKVPIQKRTTKLAERLKVAVATQSCAS